MEKINIGEWVKSALVIDDQWEEVKNLIRILNSNGVSTSYYNPNPKADKSFEKVDVGFLDKLPSRDRRSIKKKVSTLLRKALAHTSIPDLKPGTVAGYNLIFLDIDFRMEGVTQFEFQVSHALDLLNSALSKDCSPYGIVLWSREPDKPRSGNDGVSESSLEYIKRQFFGDAFPDMQKPLFVVDVEKIKFVDGLISYSQLIKKINYELQNNKMAKFFSHWNREIIHHSAATCKEMQIYSEELAKDNVTQAEVEFFNILQHATYSHFGFPDVQDESTADMLAKYSFSYMSLKLYDKLHSSFCQKKVSGIFDNAQGATRVNNPLHGVRVKECYAELNKLLKPYSPLQDSTQQEIKSAVNAVITKCNPTTFHRILAELNFGAFFDDGVNPRLKGLPGLIHGKVTRDVNGVFTFKRGEEVYLNITPPCDAAQRPQEPNTYLDGILYTYPTYSKAIESYKRIEKAKIYRTPPAFYKCGNVYLVFHFDLKSVSHHIKRACKTVFMLKDSIFTELMQEFGHYNSRFGKRSFD